MLQALIVGEWPLPQGWGDGDIQTVSIEHAKVHDLRRAFWREAQPDQVLDPAWLLPAKNLDRKEFINHYLDYFFKPDSDDFDRLIAEPYFSSHPFFSYTIPHLKHQPEDPLEFSKALAGEGMPTQVADQKNVLWFKLQSLRQTLQIPSVFQEKHRSAASETIMGNVNHPADVDAGASRPRIRGQRAEGIT